MYFIIIIIIIIIILLYSLLLIVLTPPIERTEQNYITYLAKQKYSRARISASRSGIEKVGTYPSLALIRIVSIHKQKYGALKMLALI